MSGFEVIGGGIYGDDPVVIDPEDLVEGDVMGDVMGYGGPMGDYQGSSQVIGYTHSGQPIVGAPRRPARRPVMAVQKPQWRNSQMAPGVIAPDQGMLTLPLQGVPTNTLALAQQTIVLQGQVQKPFRGERLLVSTVRTGASAVGRLQGLIFVGTDLSQLDINPVDIEQLGDPTAFGVRLSVKPAQPGVFIRIQVTLTNALAGADTIVVSAQMLGRAVH